MHLRLCYLLLHGLSFCWGRRLQALNGGGSQRAGGCDSGARGRHDNEEDLRGEAVEYSQGPHDQLEGKREMMTKEHSYL